MKKKRKMTKAQARKKADRAFDTAILLFLLAAKDELGLGEVRLVRILERIDRYSDHIDQHLVGLNDVKKILEKSTGMKFL